MFSCECYGLKWEMQPQSMPSVYTSMWMNLPQDRTCLSQFTQNVFKITCQKQEVRWTGTASSVGPVQLRTALAWFGGGTRLAALTALFVVSMGIRKTPWRKRGFLSIFMFILTVRGELFIASSVTSGFPRDGHNLCFWPQAVKKLSLLPCKCRACVPLLTSTSS